MDIISKVGSLFTGTYFHYKDVPKETTFERSMANGTNLINERADEIKRKEKDIKNELFKKYFIDYQRPSNMYEKLIETNDAKINETRVYLIKNVLAKFKKTIDYVPKNKTFKTEENEKIIDVVERILELNDKIKSGQGLKILTPNQILSGLPISLAQLKAGSNSENSKTKSGNYCILCKDQKTNQTNLQPFDQHYLKMERIFINTENSKNYSWENIKSAYNNN